MAEKGDHGAMPFLALLVGGLIVAVIAMSIFVYTGHGHGPVVPSHLSLNVKAPRDHR
jgi:hypothetical protein